MSAPVSAPVAHDEFSSLLQLVRFGACATRSDGTIVFWNRRAEQIAGVPASQAIGRRYHEIVAPPTDQAVLADNNGNGSTPRSPILVAAQPSDSLTLHLFDDHDAPSPAATGDFSSGLPGQVVAAPAVPLAEHALTRREAQVLRLMAAGMATDKIASELGISVHTVRNHVRHLRRKLDAKTKLEAVAIAFRQGLL